MRAIELLGRNWPELGSLVIAELEGGGALALSRGAEPKSYAHKDPNEDAALFVRLPEGVLLAVADGFNGVEAAELAIECARAHAETLVLADGADFCLKICALLEDVRTRLPRGSDSRACLVLAALRGASCELASFGDAFAFRAGSPLPLTQQNPILVGSEHGPQRIDPARWHRSFERAPGERIALVSDGVINFTPDPSVIPGALSTYATDVDCARGLALAALRGGAGDNVSVAAFAGDAGP